MEVSVAVEAGILTKYDPASQRYECAVCSKTGFGDVMPHMASSQHKNSAAWDIIRAKTTNEAMLSFLSETVREAKINDEIDAVDRDVFSYQCKICIGKRPFNGLTPLESHLCGIDHHKNKSRRAMSVTMKLKYDSSPIPNYSATPKNHQASSPSEYQTAGGYAHEGGARSKRNQYWPPKTLPDSLQPLANRCTNPTGGTVLRSSPTSYSQEECFPQEVVDALKSNVVVEKEKTGSWTSYFCRACNVPLTGLKPLMQHLDSAKHQKRLTGSQLLPQKSSGPSNESSGADVHDFGAVYSLSASAAEALKSGVVEERDCGYFCKVCNVPLTGPMPLSQHAESEKHRKKAGVELNRNMTRLMVQDASGQHVKEDSEWQQNQQNTPIQKVQIASDSEIITPWQHQRYQNQELGGSFKWSVRSAKTEILSEDVYRNNSLPRGFVVIFNYLFLRSLNEREGAKADSQNLKILFTQMGYQVFLYEDRNMDETLEILRDIQINPRLNDIDSFVCIILSHGKNDTIFSTTTEDLDIDDIRYLFIDTACPALKNKPKIFLMNFCRGNVKEKPRDIEYDGILPEISEAPRDMCTIYSSIKNFQAARDREAGTLFVQALCEVLAEHAHNTDLNSLYNKLCDAMGRITGTTPEMQIYHFNKKFYFNPCNVENMTI
ncbi:uncharacterized protein LOC135197844 isoform X2 [Macrobrachium nipponense]|uniref:uncharacterized protein LOC135197844 isoform X2 n=1 Tax=Macrobrachium nipponense TaxID=159736 RepID=UPI0030C813B3